MRRSRRDQGATPTAHTNLAALEVGVLRAGLEEAAGWGGGGGGGAGVGRAQGEVAQRRRAWAALRTRDRPGPHACRARRARRRHWGPRRAARACGSGRARVPRRRPHLPSRLVASRLYSHASAPPTGGRASAAGAPSAAALAAAPWCCCLPRFGLGGALGLAAAAAPAGGGSSGAAASNVAAQPGASGCSSSGGGPAACGSGGVVGQFDARAAPAGAGRRLGRAPTAKGQTRAAGCRPPPRAAPQAASPPANRLTSPSMTAGAGHGSAGRDQDLDRAMRSDRGRWRWLGRQAEGIKVGLALDAIELWPRPAASLSPRGQGGNRLACRPPGSPAPGRLGLRALACSSALPAPPRGQPGLRGRRARTACRCARPRRCARRAPTPCRARPRAPAYAVRTPSSERNH
jgi:hypothetical protein